MLPVELFQVVKINYFFPDAQEEAYIYQVHKNKKQHKNILNGGWRSNIR